MEYNFSEIEKHWKQYWTDNKVYKVYNPEPGQAPKPKYYVLDMFPYPSGAGLHVGHPLGYIASDIYARYKRLCGYNVLHPMGFDAFGLPAEQYALETGQHPAVTTEKNIARYREQLDNIGFSYDWDRQVRTSEPDYYKWTQWIFLQLFHSWYDGHLDKARPISILAEIFAQQGNAGYPCPGNEETNFTADEWKGYDEAQQRAILMDYRLAYQGYAQVWWCEALGTVLANDEVVNGVSERGGHPVERKNMRQWFLRITDFAERLLSSLDNLDWSEAMKEMQRNWIGKSNGAEVTFKVSLTPTLSKGEGGVMQDAGNVSGEDPLYLGEGRDEVQQEGNPAWMTANSESYKNISGLQSELKNNLTPAENKLWQQIRNNQLGVKFRRQHIIGKHIVDFVCLPIRLIVEVDGPIHLSQTEDDAIRTSILEEQGFKVIRFTNDEVENTLPDVIRRINDAILSPFKGEEGVTQDTDAASGESPLSLGEGRGEAQHEIIVFTTRPDTIFGVDFMVLAPEHELVDTITTAEQKQKVDEYKAYVKSRSERERMSEVKQVTGAFTGAYVIHPFTGKKIPVWISEYVLAGYGTGAIMAVPSGDDRDHAFAKHFNIDITNVFGAAYTGDKAYSSKTGNIENSDFLSGMPVSGAVNAAIEALVNLGAGKKKVNFRLRDAGFSRQRYWGEPFPIVYKNNIPYGTDELNDATLSQLPVELPMVEHYKPGPEGQGPLANIPEWMNISLSLGEGRGEATRETNTMPGYAGSSWYFLRYMDPHNDSTFADRAATDYWQQVDLYVGGTEHAVGHLLYSRMWTKALHDLGHISFDEPFKKLLNQGMIQGVSYKTGSFYVHGGDFGDTPVHFRASFTKEEYAPTDPFTEFHFEGKSAERTEIGLARLKFGHQFVDTKDRLTKSKFKEQIALEFGANEVEKRSSHVLWDGVTEDGEEYIQCKMEVEKMSKSKYNVVNPDDIVAQYGADTFRMYEMFLGPIDMSKPWDTKGIEGVHRFLKKLWRLYADEQKGWIVTDDTPTDAELKVLHKTIKKIGDDMERFSFNTSVSQFMITVNELSGMECHKRAILEPLAIIICPFAPHIAEELWHKLGHTDSVVTATYPKYEERYTVDNTKKYPVAINGKPRAEMEFALDAAEADIKTEVLANAEVQKWLEGKEPKKFIFVKGKMINLVV